MSLETPAWIQKIMDENRGGWFIPFVPTHGHPITLGDWRCFYCERVFIPGEIVAVMPYGGSIEGGEPPRWVGTHSICFLRQMGPPPEIHGR